MICGYATVVGADLHRGAVRGGGRHHVLPVDLLADPLELPDRQRRRGRLALIVSIGNLGGFVGPYLIGEIREATGSFAWALISVAAFLIVGAILIRVVGISLRTLGRAAARTAARA